MRFHLNHHPSLHTHHLLWTPNTANLSSVLASAIHPASRDAEDHRNQAPGAARGPVKARTERARAARYFHLSASTFILPRPANFSEQGCSGGRGWGEEHSGSWKEPRFRGPGLARERRHLPVQAVTWRRQRGSTSSDQRGLRGTQGRVGRRGAEGEAAGTRSSAPPAAGLPLGSGAGPEGRRGLGTGRAAQWLQVAGASDPDEGPAPPGA